MVISDLESSDKNAALQEISSHLCANGHSIPGSAELIFQALLHREGLGSTGIGGGVAIPHARIPGLAQLTGIFARSVDGIAFNSIDKAPVQLIFALLVPENSGGSHLKALARIARLFKNGDFRDVLIDITGADELYETFIAEDTKT